MGSQVVPIRSLPFLLYGNVYILQNILEPSKKSNIEWNSDGHADSKDKASLFQTTEPVSVTLNIEMNFVVPTSRTDAIYKTPHRSCICNQCLVVMDF